MEVYGIPSPELIRHLILNLRFAQPIVFRRIHKNWNPVNFSLDKFNDILSKEGSSFPCRVGKINHFNREPQWESETGLKLLSWNSIVNWNSDNEDHWIYFDYKNMKDVAFEKYLKEFEWSRLGFPERDGKLTNVWVGSAGCYTPCHFDTYGCNLVCQVKGRKKWLLFSPDDTSSLAPTRVPYEESSVYSKINVTRPSHSVTQDLIKLHGLTVILEPGDVLFVPPKWWHYVESKTFSISVNTWIEMSTDVEMRVDEAIMRSLVASFVSIASPELSVHLLNPNEEELLEASESQIEEFLRSASSDWFVHQAAQSDNSDPAKKKAKLSDSLTIPSTCSALAEFLRIENTSVKEMTSFDPLTFYGERNFRDTQAGASPPQRQTSYIAHLIDALGHPDVMKVIRMKFLDNLRNSNQ